MAKIERSALVRFSCEQMFALVNDVARYPEYMPGCVNAEVLSQTDASLSARLTLKAAGIEQSFVTCNQLQPPERMDMALVEGPFKRFNGSWQFLPLGDLGCKVIFSVEFELSNGLVALAAGKVFESVASQQVDSLCKRAEQLYKA